MGDKPARPGDASLSTERAEDRLDTAQEGVESEPPAAVLSAKERALAAEIAADGIAIQDRFRPERRYRETGQGSYESRSVEEIRAARAGGREVEP